MINFNQQLLNSLFYEKKVTYNPELFDLYYDAIFPSPQLFISFLSSNNREEQTVYAKQIIKRMCFCEYNASLFALYKNLIDLENKKLIEDADAHIPRDHSIHSVNTYLLGVFLYFSFGLFNNQLNKFFSKREYVGLYSTKHTENTFLAFLECWKIFSLNHDIGYPLELLVNKDGYLKNKQDYEIIEKLDSISNTLVEELAVNEIVFLIMLQITSNMSQSKAEEFFSFNEYEIIKRIIPEANDYVKLENIYTYRTLSYYKSAFEEKDIIIKITELKTGKNKFGYFENTKLKLIDLCDPESEYESITWDDLSGKKYSMECFYPIKKCKKVMKNALSKLSPYAEDIKNAAKTLLSQNTVSYAYISDEHSYMEFLFDIYLNVVENIFISKRIPGKAYYDKYVSDYKKFVSNKLSKIRTDVDYNAPIKYSLERIYKDILNYINTPQNEGIDEFLVKINSDIKYALEPLYNHIKGQYSGLLKLNNKNLFLDIKKTKVNIKNKLDAEFEKFVQKFISEYGVICEDSNLISDRNDIKYLLKYSPSYSLFDHGISSCFFVLENFFKATKINKMQNSLIFKTYNVNIPNRKIVCTASYSILIHNIYVDFWDSISKTSPVKHDIIKDAFSYFCLFCDNMQIWDRPYRINQGKLELEQPTVSSKDISIIPAGNKLCIHCITLEAEKIVSNYRRNLDDYLKDGSKLINLNISDK